MHFEDVTFYKTGGYFWEKSHIELGAVKYDIKIKIMYNCSRKK